MSLLAEIEEFINIHLPMLDRADQTIIGYQKDLHSFNDWFADHTNVVPELKNITYKHIEAYLYYLKVKRNYADASRLRHLHTLSSFMKYAIREEKILINPCEKVSKFSVSKKVRDSLTEEEVQELINSSSGIGYIIICVLYYAGLRISELCNLKMCDVDFKSNEIKVVNGKGKKDRMVPISKKLKKIMIRYYENDRPENIEYFIGSKRTGQVKQCYARYLMKKEVKKLGWKKNITCHNLRHSFATNLRKNGVDLVQIQKLLGHASLRTTEIYLHITNEELHEAVDVL
ncbi:tyrosine-type recombinase/integrase [Fictibacillus phosphorivorans]|uniref:tyrosine-type recombinase/integrase n=1 Tax=Fictibacillus phosphorivorans TaxID=1221500 RepID=UPI001292E1E5|nr:tyrosine-type recombinase/integrase [Fictibacillus phosphorivorans]MQR94771.1 recombinase [Fictibacillus phosphorivorans]